MLCDSKKKKKKKGKEYKACLRFHFLNLMLSVAMVAFLLRALLAVLVVAGGALMVFAAGLGGAVEVIIADEVSGDVALGGVLCYVI